MPGADTALPLLYIYIYIYVCVCVCVCVCVYIYSNFCYYIQGVPGRMCQTSEGCSLC